MVSKAAERSRRVKAVTDPLPILRRRLFIRFDYSGRHFQWNDAFFMLETSQKARFIKVDSYYSIKNFSIEIEIGNRPVIFEHFFV